MDAAAYVGARSLLRSIDARKSTLAVSTESPQWMDRLADDHALPGIAGIDVSRMLTPAATLRPGAAQTCQTKQDHGLETGLDLPELIGACASALPDDGGAPQPVYYETSVCNVRCPWHVPSVTVARGQRMHATKKILSVASSAHSSIVRRPAELRVNLLQLLLSLPFRLCVGYAEC